MKSIEYRILYNEPDATGHRYEHVTVQARTINSGFPKALKRAQEPLGSGHKREIARVEFWQVKF